MDEKREEVYERIPWETFEEKGRDRQWVVMAVAGAIVAGALAFSFMSNRSVAPPPADAVAPQAATPATSIAPPAVAPAPPPSTPPSLITEADLYAVEPGRLGERAATQARWLIREYLTADGSSSDDPMLRRMLPADIPLPTTPEGSLVFVEWVDTVSVEEVAAARFRVEVIARYMVSIGGADYQRAEPELFAVEIDMSDGTPRVVSAPEVVPIDVVAAGDASLGEIPDSIASAVKQLRPGSEVVGGSIHDDGSWGVIVLATTPTGIVRPELITIGPGG